MRPGAMEVASIIVESGKPLFPVALQFILTKETVSVE
jgi:hypothetical protein